MAKSEDAGETPTPMELKKLKKAREKLIKLILNELDYALQELDKAPSILFKKKNARAIETIEEAIRIVSFLRGLKEFKCPKEFKCLMSREIICDPVVVASVHVTIQECIEKIDRQVGALYDEDEAYGAQQHHQESEGAQRVPKYSLKPLVPRLSELLGVEVKMANDCIGKEVEKMVAALPDGNVLHLENVRFYKEEEKNDPEFAKKLASLADLYVNDAFGTAHRAHASTEGVAKYLKPSVAGFLMQKELDYLVGAVSNPKRPFAAIVGGSKVSSKIGVIESLLEKVDIRLLGGGMIFTFYKAQGYSVGSSLVEEDKLDLATSLLEKAKFKGVSLMLPSDVVIADKFAADANSKIVPASCIPDGWMGLDIGYCNVILPFNRGLDLRYEFKANRGDQVKAVKPRLASDGADRVNAAIDATHENIKTSYKVRTEMRAALRIGKTFLLFRNDRISLELNSGSVQAGWRMGQRRCFSANG